MSERYEAEVLERVKRGEISLRDAAEELGYTMRTAYRRIKRYKDSGETGLVHGLVGKRSNRAKDDDLKAQTVSMFREVGRKISLSKFVKVLRDSNIKISRETLRLWLIEAGLWQTGAGAVAYAKPAAAEAKTEAAK